MKGETWFQGIPDDWSSASVKYLFDIQLGKMLQPERDTPSDRLVKYLKAQHVQWHSVTTTDLPEMWASPKEVSQYSVRNGDLLVCEGGEAGRGAVIQDLEGEAIIQNALHRVRSKKNNARFLEYVLRSVHTSGWFDVLCNKATIAHFTGEKFGAMRIPFPPPETQKSIARFLDRKTAAIDTLIAKKQRLIQLLEEKRTALINQAVTKGLNPNAPRKDSGIPWIGEIPEHWEVARLKWKINYIDQGRSPVCANRLADDEEWGVLKVGCVNGGVFNELEHKAFPEDLLKDFEHDIYKFEIQPGDILVSRANTKELVGSAARVRSVRSKLMLCDKLYRLHLNGKVDPEFLILLLNSRLARCQFERESSGASGSMQNISQDKLADLLLPFPPNQIEQIKINQVFQERSLILQSSKFKLFEQIEKLQEYRRSLITAAVTGKLDIQEVDHAS